MRSTRRCTVDPVRTVHPPVLARRVGARRCGRLAHHCLQPSGPRTDPVPIPSRRYSKRPSRRGQEPAPRRGAVERPTRATGTPDTVTPVATSRSRHGEILAAFRRLVLEHGDRGATLDAVARAAGVSKGGLIYHFPTREALVTGLCDRFAELVDEDLVEMTTPGRSPTEWYLRTSADYLSELEQTMAALVRLAPTDEGSVRPALRRGRARWYECILAELGDEQLARTVVLLGDGIAYNAELDGQSGAPRPFVDRASIEALLRMVRALGLVRGI
nr:TetR/AcrR family transcriptional regulator [Pseudoclavibacter chungangensis]